MFNQTFLHVKHEIRKDPDGNPIVRNGQEILFYRPNKAVSGLLTRRRKIFHRRDEESFESMYIHNARLDPEMITTNEISGGDLLILINPDEVEIIAGGLLFNPSNSELIINDDGTLQIIIGELIITKNKENELPFFIETVFAKIDPNYNTVWYIRCEIRRNNTSMYE